MLDEGLEERWMPGPRSPWLRGCVKSLAPQCGEMEGHMRAVTMADW